MLYLIAMFLPVVGGILLSVGSRSYKERKLPYALLMLLADAAALAAAFMPGKRASLTLLPGVELAFHMDSVGRFLLVVMLLLYTAVLFYGLAYMDKEERPAQFFGWLFVSLGVYIALCAASNLITMYMCFEFLTLSTMPLVLHERSKEAVSAALKYLYYSVAGALLGLMAVFFVYAAGGAGEFTPGGYLGSAALTMDPTLLRVMILLGILGFGAKAGLYPLHGWLPTAHPIAPAPASALLSGIITKAGVLAILRLIYYSVGTEFLKGTFVQTAFMLLAMVTILMGSMMAFKEKVLKKRLAYSSVSQISYVLLALSLMDPEGVKGAALHLVSHASAKGCLFLAAGAFIYAAGLRQVSDLKGIGKTMPVTLGCFTAAALSLVGIPPFGGFVSKYQISLAALNSGHALGWAVPVVLILSALLTAGYLLPVVVDGYFPGEGAKKSPAKGEVPPVMRLSMIALCLVTLAAGVFAQVIVK